MKNISKLILSFFVGFYGMAFIIDTNEIILIKSKIFFIAAVVVLIIEIIADIRKKENEI